MKSRNSMVTVKTEPDLGYTKQNLKMAIGRTITQKRNVTGVESIQRGTVLVNNMPAGQRTVISNGRTVTSTNNNNNNRHVSMNNELLRCKRKITFHPSQNYPGAQPASVARRNARERNRVKQVNNGFATLRSHIPPSVAAALSTEKVTSRNSAASKKLSKVETLKMAVEYIRSLQAMLDDHNGGLDKKVPLDGSGSYESRYEVDESYYSSSPESSSQTIVSSSDAGQQYSGSPDRVYAKSETVEPDYYSPRRIYVKSEPGEVFIKSEMYRPKLNNFNQEIHDTLTSEFYNARSPVKPFYISPEGSPVENYKTFEEKSYEQLGEISVIPERGCVGSPSRPYSSSSSSSPPKGGLTVLNLGPSQVLQYSGVSFAHPAMQHRNSTSLSPTMSDACPSPTPSFSSDHSSVHHSSVVSSSSGHLTSRLSRLTTSSATPLIVESYPPLSSPALRTVSPGTPAVSTLTPPRNASPASVVSPSVVPSGVSGSSSPSYSNGLEFQKGSPEGYENYEPMSPEDEELLDAISWWQQSQ